MVGLDGAEGPARSLFSPFSLKGVTPRNRIAASPMCQYVAKDGIVTDWHGPHYAGLARGGAGPGDCGSERSVGRGTDHARRPCQPTLRGRRSYAGRRSARLAHPRAVRDTFGDELPKVPTAMDQADILGVQQDFFAAAEPARDAGFEWLVLHLAHGYLAQSPPADAGLRD